MKLQEVRWAIQIIPSSLLPGAGARTLLLIPSVNSLSSPQYWLQKSVSGVLTPTSWERDGSKSSWLSKQNCSRGLQIQGQLQLLNWSLPLLPQVVEMFTIFWAPIALLNPSCLSLYSADKFNNPSSGISGFPQWIHLKNTKMRGYSGAYKGSLSIPCRWWVKSCWGA